MNLHCAIRTVMRKVGCSIWFWLGTKLEVTAPQYRFLPSDSTNVVECWLVPGKKWFYWVREDGSLAKMPRALEFFR